jgi:hypothetical protein
MTDIIDGTVTAAGVEAEVERIRQVSADPEVAHYDEDRLHQSVLALIADGHPDAAAIARAALTTTDLDFSRWYA